MDTTKRYVYECACLRRKKTDHCPDHGAPFVREGSSSELKSKEKQTLRRMTVKQRQGMRPKQVA